MWLGLILIATQFYFGGQWQLLFGVVTNKSSKGTSQKPIISNSGTPNPNNPIFGPKGKKPL